MKNLRIFVWSDNFLPEIGGLNILCFELLKQYQALGHSVILLTTAPNHYPSIELMNNILVHRIAFYDIDEVLRGNLKKLKELQDFVSDKIQQFKPDIFHFNTNFSVYNLFLFLLFKNLTNKKFCILSLHVVLAKGIYARQAIYEKLFSMMDKITCVSKANAKILLEEKPTIKEKLSVIYNAVQSPSCFIEKITQHANKILFVGRLAPEKGVDILLQAFALLVKDRENMELIIAGDGCERENLETLVTKLNLKSKVKFLGWVEPEKIAYLINQNFMVVMPSRYESFGLVALETAKMARPLIASNIDGLAEIVIHKKTGILVPVEDIEALRSAMNLLIEHPDRAKKMGLAAKIHVDKNFHLKKMAENYFKTFEENTTACNVIE